MRRITIAVAFGLVAGCICAGGGLAADIFKPSVVNVLWVLLNRGVMGFAIGISNLKVPWAWNGVVMGLIVGSIFSYSLFMDVGPKLLPLMNFFVNGLFGLMIEFFTTKVFKAPATAAVKSSQTAVHA